jgi:small subunit ribosomal protein S20
MANHVSAAKRARQNIKRAERNRAIRTRLRNAVKAARSAIAGGDSAAAAELVKKASVLVARGVTQGILHKNAAARTISRVQSAFAKLG